MIPVLPTVFLASVVGFLTAAGVSAGTVPAAVAAEHARTASQAADTVVLWRGGMETGNLSEWYSPSRGAYGDHGGGEYNSGTGNATASRRAAHSGSWAARAVLRNGVGGTRLFRWREPRQQRVATYSAWFYFPRRYRLTVDVCCGRFLNLFQFKATSGDGNRNDPVWVVEAASAGRRGLRLRVSWHDPLGLGGPTRGAESRFRAWYTGVRVPIRRWFKITARLRQSPRFDGAITVWIGRRRVFSARNVRTCYEAFGTTAWGCDQAWSVNSYSDGLAPAPAVIYIDDAAITAAR